MPDWWTRYAAPWLDDQFGISLSPTANAIIASAVLYVIVAIIAGAILYTFYEVDRQVTRDPRIIRQLTKFYAQSDGFSRRNKTDAANFGNWKRTLLAWYAEVEAWVKENMSDAALSHFRDTSNIMPFHASNLPKEYNELVNLANKHRSNLKDLIQSSAWDTKERTPRWRLANIFRWKKHVAKASSTVTPKTTPR